MWIECYPAACRGGRAAPDSAFDGESLDVVTFVLGEKRAGAQQLEMDRSAHPWRRVTRATVEEMIGRPLPMRPDAV